MKKHVIKDTIMKLLQNQKPLTQEQMLEYLHFKGKDLKAFWDCLQNLLGQGTIVKTRFGAYGLPEKMNLLVGTLAMSSKGFGFGFVIIDKEQPDIFIPPKHLADAMHGDKVMVRINATPSQKQPEGEIIRVLERANTTIVGTFTANKGFGFVSPDNKKLSQDIFVAKKDFHGAKDGQKVVAKLTSWATGGKKAEGEIIEIIGDNDAKGVDVAAIIKQNNLQLNFSEQELQAAEKVSDTVSEQDFVGRRDMTHKIVVTIDSEDAKDLDDAVCLEKIDDKFILSVYIADVSHYVKENDILDLQAKNRATSVYLADRVLPMLPERLSNGICSLNPHQNRLVMTCQMHLDKNGKVVKHEIFEAVINITQRLSYTIVKQALEDDESILPQELISMLKDMANISQTLRKNRLAKGAIDFDLPEQKVILDDNGKVAEIKTMQRSIAESIIEEFMLLANQTVAKHLSDNNIPSIYRVHEKPDDEKIQSLKELLFSFGLTLSYKKEIKPMDLQTILTKLKGKPEERFISKVTLRSLKQAEYGTQNIHHFGLAMNYYTHFTSPIRRYPDLIIHRLLKLLMQKKLTDKKKQQLEATLPELAEHCSKQERVAELTERQVLDLKKAEYMMDFIGQTFLGTISSVTSYGLFVELDNGIEGLLHMSSLLDDYYEYLPNDYCLIGQSTKKVYRLGDNLQIEVFKVSIEDKTIDFILPGQKLLVKEQKLDKKLQKFKGKPKDKKSKVKKCRKNQQKR